MKESELKVGNNVKQGVVYSIEFSDYEYYAYVLENSKDIRSLEQYKIEWIKEDDPHRLLDYVEPIPLTEEILLKCGFEEEDVKDSIFITEEKIKIFTIDDLYLIYLDKNKCYYFAMETSLQDHWSPTLQAVSAPMQYLHTLQNYYPAFSGKELEINT